MLLDETIGHMAGKVVLPPLSEIEKNRVFRKRFDGDKKEYLPYGAKMMNQLF